MVIRCFYADEDYGFYLDWLQEYSRDTGCSIHAYVLMTPLATTKPRPVALQPTDAYCATNLTRPATGEHALF